MSIGIKEAPTGLSAEGKILFTGRLPDRGDAHQPAHADQHPEVQ